MICGENSLINPLIATDKNMKSVLFFLALSATLIITSCYSNSSKESGSDSTEKTAPMPSRSDRY